MIIRNITYGNIHCDEQYDKRIIVSYILLEIYGIHYTLRIYFIIHYTLHYIGQIFDISFCDPQRSAVFTQLSCYHSRGET